MSDLHQFNPGRKSWKMYTKELTSISGDDLTITPYDGQDLILEVSGNKEIIFKKGDVSYNLADLSNAASSNVNLTNYDDASFGNVDISGGIIITVNDVNSQNITLLELKTKTNTPLIKHDFWQNSSGYADYQIYPASASTTDFKIGGYNSTFETIRLNALNGIQIYSNQSTNSYGNIKGNDASLNNVDLTGNLNIKSGNLDISNGVINFFATDEQLLGPDTGIVQKVVDLSNSVGDLSNSVGDLSNNLLTANNDASFNNVQISGTIRIETDTTQTIRFFDTQGGGSPDENGRIEVAQDGSGGEVNIYTSDNGTGVTEKLRINKEGKLGFRGADYGSVGDVLTNNASGLPEWKPLNPFTAFGAFYLATNFTVTGTKPINNIVDDTAFPTPFVGMTKTSNQNIQLTQAGVYRFTWYLSWNYTQPGSSLSALFIKSGTTIIHRHENWLGPTWGVISGSRVINVTANQTFYFEAQTTSNFLLVGGSDRSSISIIRLY